MRTHLVVALAMVALCAMYGSPVTAEPAQTAARPDCRETTECRRLALEAAARGAYETFHDLVWRAIQTGRANDPELMYLLARAQCLSNRPHDALVILRRLAEMGVFVDTAHEDLARVRALSAWPALAAFIERQNSTPRRTASPGTASAAPPSPAPAPSPDRAAPRAAPSRAPAPTVPAPPAAPPLPRVPADTLDVQLLPTEEAVRFSAERFVAGGLAYDSVSRRFVLGDHHGRKLMVVAEGSRHTVDMVRADSAGFHDVTAIDIDRTRGDLWVVTTLVDGAGTLHKLQLVSGRMLSAFDASPELQPVRFTDVAVTAAGSVLVLDSAGPRLLGVRAGAKRLEPITRLAVETPSGLATTDDERVVYVAHRDGIIRVDLTTGTTRPLTGPPALELGRFERIRWFRNSLVGVQAAGNGSRRIVRLHLNRGGSAVTRGVVVDASVGGDGGQAFATISGDDLYYLELPSGTSSGAAEPTPAAGMVDVAVQRIRLR